MVFKPFTHIARQSFTKAFTHGYAQSVVAASQSSYASSTTLNHLTVANPAKFSRTTQLQHVFQPSSSSGAGAKASQGGSGGGDAGLAAYYAAWQQAQQTGDDSDWKQLQLKRRVGWKPLTEEEVTKHQKDEAELSAARSDLNRSPHLTQADANEDVSAKVEEAVAREIQRIADRVFLMGKGRPPAVLEVVAVALAHEFVANATEVDPQVGQLMREQRPRVKQFAIVDSLPLIT